MADDSKPRVVAIVAARMTSTRLPGKVLADLCGRPMLEQQLRRLARAATVDQIVVATTDRSTDDRICRLLDELGVAYFRGSEHDVLARYAQCSDAHDADVVVRITADCPLLVPELVDSVVGSLLRPPRCDYASNVVERRFPQGLDVEAIDGSVLAHVAAHATSKLAREHVTWHIVREARAGFSIRSVRGPDNHSALRWTVDTPDDLALVRQIYGGLQLTEHPRSYREILDYVLARPHLARLNAHVQQKHQ